MTKIVTRQNRRNKSNFVINDSNPLSDNAHRQSNQSDRDIDSDFYRRASFMLLQQNKIKNRPNKENKEKYFLQVCCKDDNRKCILEYELYYMLVLLYEKLQCNNRHLKYRDYFESSMFDPESCLRTIDNRTKANVINFGLHPKNFTLFDPADPKNTNPNEHQDQGETKSGDWFSTFHDDGSDYNCNGVYIVEGAADRKPEVFEAEINNHIIESFITNVCTATGKYFESDVFPFFYSVSFLHLPFFRNWLLCVLNCLDDDEISYRYKNIGDTVKDDIRKNLHEVCTRFKHTYEAIDFNSYKRMSEVEESEFVNYRKDLKSLFDFEEDFYKFYISKEGNESVRNKFKKFYKDLNKQIAKTLKPL